MIYRREAGVTFGDKKLTARAKQSVGVVPDSYPQHAGVNFAFGALVGFCNHARTLPRVPAPGITFEGCRFLVGESR
jgi:hypothetical protein